MTITRRHVGAPCRFEVAVRELLGDVSRRLARRLIDEGSATLNGRPARKGATVHAGDALSAPILPPLTAEPNLQVTVLDVHHEIAVLDKPAPMATLPLDPRERGTLAGFVVGRWPRARGVGGALVSGIAHRLDTGSSGLVLSTTNAMLWRALRAGFAQRQIRKEYVAIVASAPPVGPISIALAHDPQDSRRMTTARQGRRWPAETVVTSVEPLGTFWRVDVCIRTGVTHQIRAHLASLGSPVVGDILYGGPTTPTLPNRHALHATTIEVPDLAGHPGGRWHSPLPTILATL